MGHKAGAKRIMAAAGVPCVPGYDGDDQSDDRMLAEAERIGFPLMIKAALGGGGRGMRLVSASRELPEALTRARSEATSAFGDGTLILERAIIEPRHVEIQVFADRHGNAIHLGERDCSVQRRHQKLVEESPSPAVDAELRARMGKASLAAVNAIAYEGAGTLEFLLDRTGHFYFMEMNTRLQVEHPVTEAVTGLDLVELQLRIAAGEALPLDQDAVRLTGHAIEVRLCAEDAEASFMPASGRMLAWRMPSALRVEHALEAGAEIPPFYDSMIAKLVAHGRTRDEARRKLGAGLDDAVALGVVTNQAFLASCLAHPVFAAGDATTAFIEQNRAELLARDPEIDARAAALTALLFVALASPTPSRRAVGLLPLTQRILLGSTEQVATLTPEGDGFAMTVNGYAFAMRVVSLGAEDFRFECDGLVETAAYAASGVRLFVRYRGRSFQARGSQPPEGGREGVWRSWRWETARRDERPDHGGAGGGRRHGQGRTNCRDDRSDEDGESPRVSNRRRDQGAFCQSGRPGDPRQGAGGAGDVGAPRC